MDESAALASIGGVLPSATGEVEPLDASVAPPPSVGAADPPELDPHPNPIAEQATNTIRASIFPGMRMHMRLPERPARSTSASRSPAAPSLGYVVAKTRAARRAPVDSFGDQSK